MLTSSQSFCSVVTAAAVQCPTPSLNLFDGLFAIYPSLQLFNRNSNFRTLICKCFKKTEKGLPSGELRFGGDLGPPNSHMEQGEEGQMGLTELLRSVLTMKDREE